MSSTNSLKHILSNWSLGTVLSSTMIQQGDVNQNWMIVTSYDTFILKKVIFERTIPQLLFEFDYLEYLENQKFSYKIPKPLKTIHGQRFVEFQGFYYWIYRYIKGEIMKPLNLSNLREIAQMITKIHSILQSSDLDNNMLRDSQIAPTFVFNELIEFKIQITAKTNKKGNELKFLECIDQLLSIHKSLHDPTYSEYPAYPIHRDINPNNLIWHEGRIKGIIDFENVSMMNDTFLKDIAIIIQTCCNNRNNPIQTDLNLSSEFLKEYNKIFSLQKKDIRYLSMLFTAGAIEDFAYAYWQLVNDPIRGSLSNLDYYAKKALWHHQNTDRISTILAENLSLI